MSDFKIFADAVRRRFEELSEGKLLITDTDRDAVWAAYIGAFPTGGDPLFRKRTEHDCSCCKNFIRQVGGVVAVVNGKLATVWDHNALPEPYQTVADAMAAYVRSLPIRDVFFTKQSVHGAELTVGMVGNSAVRFNHFSVKIPTQCVSREPEASASRSRGDYDVLERGLRELTTPALDTMIELIDGGALYRGAEFAPAVKEFAALKRTYDAASPEDKKLIPWSKAGALARFRNTAIGTLAQSLSDGADIAVAVAAYDRIMAPTNYKRTSAPITKNMVQDAVKVIDGMGLTSALERRHARLSDVSVRNVLFVDNAVRGKMRDGSTWISDILMTEVKPVTFDSSKAKEISVHDFVKDVLPKTTELRLQFDNALTRNLVSVTAPVDPDAGRLFKWSDNNFAWSYEGDAADSIKARVKTAGGKVEGISLRVSLSWKNTDDLDLHVREPGGNHVYYGNRRTSDRQHGVLDVDMNVMRPVRDAVENVRWTEKLCNGVYTVSVHNYTKRETIDVGFEVEVESNGQVSSFSRENAVRQSEETPVCQIHVKNGVVTSIVPGLNVLTGAQQRDAWGLKTLTSVRVDSVVVSPNHWSDPGVGNKHWFFVLEGCKNPMPTRGIYNEFLRPELDSHRKVFEVLADKTKCQPSDEQLSGVGFSAGRGDCVHLFASGPTHRAAYTVTF